ncbi:hypothetical protein B0H10DRAFT_2244490 [Mycena sp. CBHHK59/15]|nr:hypothetical protein B0H10DRAFT_2244490 [Mycena sp. CBHHK59/15]
MRGCVVLFLHLPLPIVERRRGVSAERTPLLRSASLRSVSAERPAYGSLSGAARGGE